jgi:hypothetical protein
MVSATILTVQRAEPVPSACASISGHSFTYYCSTLTIKIDCYSRSRFVLSFQL